MKKILFYPGTFNPPHLGHASAVLVALKNVALDEVWIFPSGKRVDRDEKFVIIKRSGYEFPEELASKNNLLFLEEDVAGISSTKIREMVAAQIPNLQNGILPPCLNSNIRILALPIRPWLRRSQTCSLLRSEIKRLSR